MRDKKVFSFIRRGGLLLAALLLCACASLSPDYDEPKISFESIKALPSDGAAPRFEIKLRVANPNTQTLDIAGISYGIDLLGKEVVAGVTSDVPKIAGYSEEIVTVEAGVNMLQAIRLIADVAKRTETGPLAYRFTAKVDFNGLMPTQRLEQHGELSLD